RVGGGGVRRVPHVVGHGPIPSTARSSGLPARDVLPKPYWKPPPPMWLACSSPPTFVEAGELGLGSLCFTFGTPAEIAENVRGYKEAIKRWKTPIAGYINHNLAVTANKPCLSEVDQARWLHHRAPAA